MIIRRWIGFGPSCEIKMKSKIKSKIKSKSEG